MSFNPIASPPAPEAPETLEERAELAGMVERLARSPRLSNLLNYVGQKYFSGESDQIREYNIAIEVFGRPSTFDPGQDAIARVEAHRLRKKLKEYYEAEGRDRKIQIRIPPGSYIPVFIHQPPAEAAAPVAVPTVLPVPIADLPPEPVEPTPLETDKPDQNPINRAWLWFAAAILLLAFAVWAIPTLRRRREIAPNRDQSRSAIVPVPAPLVLAAEPVRILAGYTGQPHIGVSGEVWGPDRFFHDGRAVVHPEGFVARTNDPFLFRWMRTGEFTYDIPLAPGVYELHLYFLETDYGPGLGGGELSRTFSLQINGSVVLHGFDIVSDAMGPNIADERVITDVSPAKDGKLHLYFESERGQPIVSAIEILPGLPHRQLPVRLHSQPQPYIDHSGMLWLPDNFYLGGQPSPHPTGVQGTAEPELYSTERYGHFSYAIPVDPRGTYTLVLHFAEFYFGGAATRFGGIGSRLFNVMCDGGYLAANFDIYREAGPLHALVKTFHHLKPTAQGKLNLTFEPIANYATVSAIEVIGEGDESR